MELKPKGDLVTKRQNWKDVALPKIIQDLFKFQVPDNVDIDSENKPVEGDRVEKTDSGMEEESNSEPLALDDSDDDGDEDVIVRKQANKSKSRLILDEDSDNGDEESITSQKPQAFTAEEVLQAVLEASSDDNRDDLEAPSTVKKRKIKRPVTDDSSDDEEKQKDGGKAEDRNVRDSGDEDKVTSDADEGQTADVTSVTVSRKDEKTQLTEDSDSSDSRSSSGSDSEHSDNNNEDDEGFNEDSIDPKLLAKLKKGAGKKQREKSARISKKEGMISLHSESQRIVREGRVNLPYHQPAPKSLNDFLARASKKQQEYRNLTGSVRNQRKAKVIEGVLQNTRLQTRAKTQEELDKYSDSDEDYDPTKTEERSLKERIAERLQETHRNPEETDNDVTSEIQAELSAENGTKIDKGKENVNIVSEDSQDSLPDLYVVKESEKTFDKDIVIEENSAQVLTADKSINKEGLVLNASEKMTTDEPLHVLGRTDKDTENRRENSEHSSLESMEVNSEHVIECKEDLNKNKENINEEKCTKSKDNESKTSPSQKTTGITSPKSAKKLKKERLLALAGIDLNAVKPCLSGETESFISLVEADEAPKHPGLVKLMDRLTKHTAKKEKKKSRDMDISIVSKDKIGMDKEELKLNTFTYHIEEENSNPLMKLETPGAKLIALKEQLKGKIKEKREEARQKRQELYNLDNEEGDFGAEEEEEMSEHSDTDVDEDGEFDEQFGGDYDDEEEMITEKKRKKNAFADEEAKEDGEEEDEEGILEDDNDDGDKDDEYDDDEGAEADDEDDMNLKLDVSDEEEDESVEAIKDQLKKLDRKEGDAALSEENDTKDVQDFKEPSPKKLPDKPFSMFGQRSSSRDSCLAGTQLQSGQKSTSLRLQIEDTQDLYGTLPQLAPTQEPSNSQSSPQSYNFLLEDSQSVMLDADGYLKTKSISKTKPVSKITALDDMSETQDDMDVLGLCSGKFVSQLDSKDKTSKKSLFDDRSVSNTQNMEEFMGLCSGVFVDSKMNPSQTQGKKRKVSSDDENDSIEALSDNEERNSLKDIESDNDNDGDTDDLGDDGEEAEEKQKQFTGFLQKRGKIRKEFVEEEAELSGSEFDSDENLDLPEEEDIMELEEADKEVANIDQEQLRDEVGRVHLKQLIDEDKRELLRFQEMYLADGDLHPEGGGRMRRFRWSNIASFHEGCKTERLDDDTQQDMFGDGSDDEGHEQEDTEELQWRKERYEREKFLKDQQDKELNDSENSQFLKFGKVFLKRQESVESNSAKKDSKDVKQGENVASNQAETPGFPGSFYKLSKQKRGSFLARSKEALAKIAEMTKPATNPSAGAKSSGKFTFQVISPGKENSQESVPTKKERKAHKPTPNADTSFKKPPMKRQKLDTNAKSQSSIFNHL